MIEVAPLLLELWVPGHPRTKGSMEPQIVKGKGGVPRVRLTETDESKAWAGKLIKAVKDVLKARSGGPVTTGTWVPVREAVACREVFWTPHNPMNIRSGDIEKHVRQVHDALTKALFWEDDKQCSELHAFEEWAVGTTHGPGVMIQVWPRYPGALGATP